MHAQEKALGQQLAGTADDDTNEAKADTPRPRRGTAPPAIGDQGPAPPRLPSLVTETSARNPAQVSDRTIGHIEHYAHVTDFVALWGVLHFSSARRLSPSIPRFMGRVFARTSHRGGHQFCQHYLDDMFPLECHPKTGEFIGCKETGNDFMESDILVGREGDESANVREAYKDRWMAALDGTGNGIDRENLDDLEVKIHGGSPILSRSGTQRTVKVKDLSRLWQYRNGKSPDDRPPLMGDGPNDVGSAGI